MSTINPRAQSHDSVLTSGYNAVSARVFAGLKAIERRISYYREEAALRSLDRRLLEDIGFEPFPKVEYRPDHTCRNEFTPLWEVFSWTRFGK
jgi:hypothetical protein